MSQDMEAGGSSQLGLSPLHNQGASPAALADTVTALTSDPNFSAALAAAISSVFGGGGTNANNGNVNATTSNNNGSTPTSNNNTNGNNKVNGSSCQGN